MTKEEAIAFLRDFAWNCGGGTQLILDAYVGFGRECVGIGAQGTFLVVEEMRWEVEPPEHAYHKADVLCVLGHEDDKIIELADWCQRLQAAGWTKRGEQIREPGDLAGFRINLVRQEVAEAGL